MLQAAAYSMLGTKTFINSLKQIFQDRADYFFLFYHFLMFSGRIRQLNISNDANLVIYLLVTLFYSLLMKKLKIGKQLFYIVLVFLLISIPSLLFFGYSLQTLLGFIIRLTIGYLIISYFKEKFILYFHNLMFVLAYISIPLYLVQVFYLQFYEIFTPFTEAIIPTFYLDRSDDFQYLLVFGINGWATLRNSGMFSEPSVYASMLAWAMIINLNNNKYRYNTILAVFFLASLSLFSLGMMIYLIPISILFIIHNIKKKYLFSLVRIFLILIIFIPLLMRTSLFTENYEMMSRKIQLEKTNRELVEEGSLDSKQVSRVTGFKNNMEYFLSWPFGYGFFRSGSDSFMYLGASPNGFATQLVNWGIAFIIVVTISAIRFSRILQFYSQKGSTIALIFVSVGFILPISGTSLTNEPLYLSILLWPILIFRSYFIINTGKAYENNGVVIKSIEI